MEIARAQDAESEQQRLREENDRLRFLLNHSPAVVYTCEAHGAYAATYITPNVQRQMGHAPEAFIRDPSFWGGRIHPDDQERVFEELAEIYHQDTYTHEYRRLHADGVYRWVRDTLRLVRDADGSPAEIIGVWTDIHERKVADESPRTLSTVLEQAAEAVTIANLDGVTEYVNPAFERLTGYSREEAVGVVPSMFLSRRVDIWEPLLAGSSLSTELVERRKDGAEYHVAQTATPIRDAAGRITHVATISRDITARKRAEEEIRVLNADLERQVADRTAALNTEVSEHRATADLLRRQVGEFERLVRGARCILWRAQVEERDGVLVGTPMRRDALEHQTFLPLDLEAGEEYHDAWRRSIPAEDRERLTQARDHALRAGLHGYAQEYRCVDNKGVTHWVHDDVSVEPIGAGSWRLVGVLTDITERKEAEDGLRASEERFALVMQGTNDGIWDLDLSTGDVYYSPQWKTMLGYSEDELDNALSTWESLVHPDDLGPTKERFQAFLDGRETDFEDECRMRGKDGRYRHIQRRAFAVRSDSDRRAVRVVGRHVDVTRRKQDELRQRDTTRRLEHALAELRSTQEAVVQQERLRALGEMASGIAHDFNNALSPILGFSELLISRPETFQDTAKALRYLDMMNTAARDAANVVSRMREFYRKREKGDVLRPVDPAAIITEAIALTQPKWKNEAQARGGP